MKVGRDYSFSSLRVLGSWHGERCGVQFFHRQMTHLLPMSKWLSILSFLNSQLRRATFGRLPITGGCRSIAGSRFSSMFYLPDARVCNPADRNIFWALVPCDHDHAQHASRTDCEIKWVQQFFFAKLGEAVIDELSPPAARAA